MSLRRGLCGVVAALLLLGCRSLERFDTEPGVAFCGNVAGAPLINDGFLVDGQPPRLSARIRLDTTQLDATFGTLTTSDTTGLCAPSPLFDEAPLRAISQVQHDQLWLFDFGEGRDQNLMAWVDSTCLGTMVAIVSLMRDDSVELRLLKPRPAPTQATEAAERPGFALFQLQRRKGQCGF